MISKRKLRDRMQRSADESFSTPSSTLMERLPEMARASAESGSPVLVRAGRRIFGTLASIGMIGWLTMSGAGALMAVAAVGDLPDPVQQIVADVVHVIGIDLPNPAQEKVEQQNPASSSTIGRGITGGSPPGNSSDTPTVSVDPGVNGSSAPGGASVPSTTSSAASRPTTTTKPTTTTTMKPTTTTTKPGRQTQEDDSRQTNAVESSSKEDSFSRSERDD